MAKILLIVCGLLALAMAGLCAWIGVSSRKQTRHAEDLRPLEIASIEDGELATPGYLEARLSNSNLPAYRDLVLFSRSRLSGFRKVNGSRVPVWRGIDRRWPGLKVDIADGSEVRIGAGYRLVFQGSDPSYLTTQELEKGVTERYEGLKFGQPVVVLGKVAEDEFGRFLAPEVIASGDYAGYLEGESASARFGFIAGAVLGLVSLVLIVIGIQL